MRQKTVFSKKLSAVLLLGVFLLALSSTYLVISLTPFAYHRELVQSYPPLEGASSLFPVGILGPAPNSTDVPLDTAIVIALTRPVNIENLNIAPQGPAVSKTIAHSPPASETYIFCFTDPLKPATTYNVTALSGGKPITWNFTTTAEPYEPRYSTYLYPYTLWVALAVAAFVTVSVFLIILHKKEKRLRS